MALELFRKKDRKACVIGLDGLPYTLLKSFIEGGVMPRTGEVVSRGKLLPMRASLPEISSVSWSTFMTGKNPGEHGIFGFTDIIEQNYSLRFPSFHDLKVETIWDIMGRKGLRSLVINQPSTYPAREIPGVLVSGFVAIELDKSVYPLRYASLLKRSNYLIDIEPEECRKDPEKLFSYLGAMLEGRKKILGELWRDENWNFLEVVVTGTDRLHHFLWDAYENQDHPQHEAFLDYYRRVDDFVSDVYQKLADAGQEENFFILSDHGFCGTKKEVYINNVLKREGYLYLVEGGPPSLEGIDERTKAFALDPARVYINKKSRFARGGVEERDVASLNRDLRALFGELSCGGENVLIGVHTAESIYSGPCLPRAPDLVLVPRNGYDLKGKVGAEGVFGEPRLRGMHTWENAFFFSSRSDLLEGRSELEIGEAASMILGSIEVEP